MAPTAAYHQGRRAAQLRAAGLLASSLVMVTLVGLVGFRLIHWGWAFVGIALLAATVAGLRHSVARSRRARAHSRPRTRAAGRPAVRPLVARPELAAQAAAVTMPRTARRAVDLEARRPAAGPAVAPYDLAEVEAQLTQPAPDEVAAHRVAAEFAAVEAPLVEAEPPAPGSWEPVPVPPPTYTLKAKAYRAPAELPADGAEMALEEEFEELPQVHRVG